MTMNVLLIFYFLFGKIFMLAHFQDENFVFKIEHEISFDVGIYDELNAHSS